MVSVRSTDLASSRFTTGDVMRDVERQVAQVAESGRAVLLELIDRTKRILAQKPKDKNKLYALHAPEVQCMAKGKARKLYEFRREGPVSSNIHFGGI
jgi:transposase, IS5 family